MKNKKNSTENKSDNIYPTFIDVQYGWQQAKKNGYTNSNLYIKMVEKKGFGVFSKNDIKNGEVIEYCHSILIETPRQWMRDQAITKYSYWSNDQGVLPLGFGPIYNSAERQHLVNASYFIFPEDALIVFVAQKDISAHEEILVWWGDGYYDSWCKPNNLKS
jgi:hypothetical protein